MRKGRSGGNASQEQPANSYIHFRTHLSHPSLFLVPRASEVGEACLSLETSQSILSLWYHRAVSELSIFLTGWWILERWRPRCLHVCIPQSRALPTADSRCLRNIHCETQRFIESGSRERRRESGRSAQTGTQQLHERQKKDRAESDRQGHRIPPPVPSLYKGVLMRSGEAGFRAAPVLWAVKEEPL